MVATLEVGGQEAGDTPMQPERDGHLREAGDRECQRERSVLGLAEMAGDEDLGREVDPERDEPADDQQCRAADVRGALGNGVAIDLGDRPVVHLGGSAAITASVMACVLAARSWSRGTPARS